MSQEPQKNNAVLIIIAIIGLVGTIIATTIGVIGNYNIEKLRQDTELTQISLNSIAKHGEETRVSMESTMFALTLMPYYANELQPTYTPYPTYTPIPSPIIAPTTFVEPPIIVATSLPDQQLTIGSAYQGNGFRVILKEMWVRSEINFYFEVYNDRTSSLIFSTMYSYAHLYDDVGNEYQITTIGSNDINQYEIYPSSFGKIGNFGQLNFHGPISSSAHYLIFEYEQILGLSKLTWRIPVNQ